MIMEDFVPFEIAKKLKEKGFDYPCVGHYFNNKLYTAHCLTAAFFSNKDESIDAPTISQTLKWLREEKNIILILNPYFNENCCVEWDCDVWIDGKYIHCCEDYKTYEEAAIAGIEYVLDNLI